MGSNTASRRPRVPLSRLAFALPPAGGRCSGVEASRQLTVAAHVAVYIAARFAIHYMRASHGSGARAPQKAPGDARRTVRLHTEHGLLLGRTCFAAGRLHRGAGASAAGLRARALARAAPNYM